MNPHPTALAAALALTLALAASAQAQTPGAGTTLAPGQYEILSPANDPCSTENIMRMHENALNQALQSERNILEFNQQRTLTPGTAAHAAQADWVSRQGDFDNTPAPVTEYDQEGREVTRQRRPEDACWGRTTDVIKAGLGKVKDGVVGIFNILGDIGTMNWPEWGEIDIGALACSAARRVDRTTAGTLYTIGRLPELWIGGLHRGIRWQARYYENYGRWKLRRKQQAPDRYGRTVIRDWTSDLPISPPWGYPDNAWPSEWRRRGGGY